MTSRAQKRARGSTPARTERSASPPAHVERARGPTFDEEVARVVRAIPPGSVLSYGDVAKRAGAPRAARAVAKALSRGRGLPWWRVIRADGSLAAAVAGEQAVLLRAEGVRIVGDRVRV